MTSAECGAAGPDTARLGDHDLSQEPDCQDDGECADPAQEIPVDTVINLADQEIALIKLSNIIKENDFVSPVCLQFGQQGNITEFDSFERVGWSEKKLIYSTFVEELENTPVVKEFTLKQNAKF